MPSVLRCPLPVARIIASRGIPVDDVANFINPKLQNLMPDPFCMKDMEKAAKRIAEAIVKKQKVAIIGDYDVDRRNIFFGTASLFGKRGH